MAKLARKSGAAKRAHMRRLPKTQRAAVSSEPKKEAQGVGLHDELHVLLRVAYIRRVSGPSGLLRL
jgi:hypothetical protein